MEKELPVRKKIRLEGYDYSQDGYYHITICVENGLEMLGKVDVGDGVLDVPFVKLSEYGIIAEKRITALNEHYEHISIQKYVIMPNHIHILLSVLNNPVRKGKDGTSQNEKSGTSRTPSPTNAVIPSFVSTLKRFIHKDCGFILFQRAYHDRIIRDKTEYYQKCSYIEQNPVKWAEDEYHNLQENLK